MFLNQKSSPEGKGKGRFFSLALYFLSLLVVALSAQEGKADQAMRRIEIAAPVDRVWVKLRDFCAIKDWHPAFKSCVLDTENYVSVRTLTSQDGAIFIERLTNLSEAGHAFSYDVLTSPLPVQDFRATMKVLAGAGGRTIVIWTSAFKVREGIPRDAAINQVYAFFTEGLEHLKRVAEAAH